MTSLMRFPEPSQRIRDCLDDLSLVNPSLTPGLQGSLLPEAERPRPWDITTIHTPALRWDVWKFLDAFVIWFNSQHTWYAKDQIPACWPHHPPLIHSIGTMAFQRLAIAEATEPHTLDEWHRYIIPTFLERTHEQRSSCHDQHHPWPGRAEHTRHTNENSTRARDEAFRTDCDRHTTSTPFTTGIRVPAARQPHTKHTLDL